MSLLTTFAHRHPSAVENDLAITALNSPKGNVCSGEIRLELTIINNGTNKVNSAAFRVSVNSTSITEKIELESALEPVNSTVLFLGNVMLPEGESSLEVENHDDNEVMDAKTDGKCRRRSDDLLKPTTIEAENKMHHR